MAKPSTKIRVAIIGGSGYAGGELLRILLNHPEVEVTQATSRRYAKLPVTIAHPNLRGVTSLRFSKIEQLEPCDVLFIALPNGKSQEMISGLEKLAPKIIDLGADYRLTSPADYKTWYGEHRQPEYFGKFTYGLAELHREQIKQSNYVACGGCEATCSILTLYPLFKHGLVEPGDTVIDAKLGSSAAGGEPSLSTHHPERAGVVRSYKPTMHRHTAEIEQELAAALGSEVKVHVSATAIEMVRGILVTCHAFLKTGVSASDVLSAYKTEYGQEPFIRIINEKFGIHRFPEPKLVMGTNYCDIAFELDAHSNRIVVVGAIDNLTKGTAGQAVQAMNLMCGFPETAGLNLIGLHPV